MENQGDFYIHQGERSERRDQGGSGWVANWTLDTLARFGRWIPRTRNPRHFVPPAASRVHVIATTDMGGRLLERYEYTPYGQVTVHQKTSFGDRDGDLDVDSTDKGTVGTTCTGTVSGFCRILDLDFDGDYDSTDATKFDALASGISRHPGRTWTGVSQPFAHQGLLFEPEIGSYQNRAREYSPLINRFLRRDPLGYRDGTNFYRYLGSAPLCYLDPSGNTVFTINDGACNKLLDLLKRITGENRWKCCGNKLVDLVGPWQNPCYLCDLLAKLMLDNHTYTVLLPINSHTVTLGRSENDYNPSEIYLDLGDLGKLPANGSDASSNGTPEATTQEEIVAHEFEESWCRTQGGGESCHRQDAMDAEDAVRSEEGQSPTDGFNRKDDDGWVNFLHRSGKNSRFKSPNGPFDPIYY